MSFRRTALFTAAGLLALGGGWLAYRTLHTTAPVVGAGQPLPAQSSSLITVLPGQEGETATPVTQSNQPLASSATISIVPPTPAAPPPAVFDATAARLGTTLSLLVSAWPNGGPLPRQLAAAASQVAQQTNQPQVAQAAAALRSATPREGPLTLPVLLLETSHALTLTPPENLPQDDAAAQARKSWFRKQLEQLVHISSTPATQNRWSAAMLLTQQQLVRGSVADAAQTLSRSPLVADARLNALRDLVRAYISQTGKLTALVSAYTSTYLKPDDAE